jgi:hypothetical protein
MGDRSVPLLKTRLQGRVSFLLKKGLIEQRRSPAVQRFHFGFQSAPKPAVMNLRYFPALSVT